VDLQLPTTTIGNYRSGSQRARVSTEPWAEANLYCPACESPKIDSLPTGTHAADFKCPVCASRYQLKSQRTKVGDRILDGAYAAMQRAITSDETPNLFLLHYKLPQLTVENVFLIPHFAFSMSCVEKRKALSPTARRAGYVGCYFVLNRIPSDARIQIVQDGRPTSSSDVRSAYEKLRPLEKLNVKRRGWTLDVLNIVKSLNKTEFKLKEVYEHEDLLAKFHPDNAHIQPKIRQQLQELRDMKLVKFLGDGHYLLL
jgi:type II restriction enzyme